MYCCHFHLVLFRCFEAMLHVGNLPLQGLHSAKLTTVSTEIAMWLSAIHRLSYSTACNP